ncbi:hypothetical protein LIER_23319 [Lithospermum erythrorhizon]|uniref:Protein DGCR14 n=1 Tax=Lithospermum erythrorhizon TaxID=34254 RepID=A0AAV3QX09_LITER
MLSSPGKSPRHLSTPTPTPQNPNPTSLPKKQSTVLDEDTYVAAIEKIIERDFFPDIPKLRDRLDWLEAVRSRDPLQIRDAQLKILERRRAIKKPSSSSSNLTTPVSAFFRNSLSITPFSRFNEGNSSSYGSYIDNKVDRGDGEGEGEGEDGVEGDLSLDEFFRRYTSEDNESFEKLIEKVNRKRKERYDYLLEGEKGGGVELIEDVKREKVETDGYGTSDQPVATLKGWDYTAKNLLMYHPADNGEVALTEEERGERLKGLTKVINKGSTRFHGKMSDSVEKEEDTVAVLYTPVAGGTPVPFSDRDRDRLRKYDLEDLRKTPDQFYVETGKKADNGYSFVKTPSPAPGEDGSPFITWGEIEGTPLRLETEDTPIDIGGSGNGPHFKIPMPPTRDLKAHSLSREAARKIRERSNMFQKPPLPSPVRGGSATPRTLSPAAQKFVRKAISKSSQSLDESLRATYRGSSPGLGTPKSGRSVSRLGRHSNMDSRSPSLGEGSNPPW